MATINYIGKKEFAELCNVSPGGVTRAIKSGLVQVSHNGKINPQLVKNLKYKVTARERAKKRPPTRYEMKKQYEEIARGVKSELQEEQIMQTEVLSKTAIEIARIQAQTTKLNMDIAENTGRLILREIVASYFGQLASVFTSLAHPMGQRIAPAIADVMDVEDPEIILKIQDLIDKENERIINEVKRVTADADTGE